MFYITYFNIVLPESLSIKEKYYYKDSFDLLNAHSIFYLLQLNSL